MQKNQNNSEQNDPLPIELKSLPYGMIAIFLLGIAVSAFIIFQENPAEMLQGEAAKQAEAQTLIFFSISLTLSIIFMCLRFRFEILKLNGFLKRITIFHKANRKKIFHFSVSITVLTVLITGLFIARSIVESQQYDKQKCIHNVSRLPGEIDC